MIRIILLIFTFLIPCTTQDAPFYNYQKEQLIIFIQSSDSDISSNFQKEILPQIESLANEEGVEYILQEVDTNAPKEVTYTPFIAFRDVRGVSYFSGRWNQVSKVKNFIRSTRVIHQQKEVNLKEDILALKEGRMNLVAPLKVTELKGKMPKKYTQESFKQEALSAIELGSSKFNRISNIDATLSTRSFYWAIYPYRDDSGKYHITGEIYSQYNCVDPVYTHFETPVVNKDCKKAFQEMARILEIETFRQVKNPENGDGFDIVNNIEEVSWESFGAINNYEEGKPEIDWSTFQSKKEWKVKGAFADNVPLLYFKFIQPLDGYTGEVTELEGELSLENPNSINKAKGDFSIPITAITMGDKGLDKAIHTSILNGEKYPEATFNFDEIKLVSGNLKGEDPSNFTTTGFMELKGKQIAIDAKGMIKPYIRDNRSYLNVNLKFGIDKSEFGVEKGPDGPDEIKEQMEFYMNFLME